MYLSILQSSVKGLPSALRSLSKAIEGEHKQDFRSTYIKPCGKMSLNFPCIKIIGESGFKSFRISFVFTEPVSNAS